MSRSLKIRKEDILCFQKKFRLIMIANLIKSTTLLLILLNPFLLIIYLLDLVQELDTKNFLMVLTRAGLISGVVFVIFALVGEALFSQILHAKFASFQIFGGIIFLIIGIRFTFIGEEALKELRGKPEHIVGAIAMPIMIGPATVSASILIGNRLNAIFATAAIVIAIFITILVMHLLKILHDFVKPRNERIIQRYVEIMGRITALIIGIFSIEMIMQGLKTWLAG